MTARRSSVDLCAFRVPVRMPSATDVVTCFDNHGVDPCTAQQVEIGQAAEAGAYDEDFTMLWGVLLGVHVNLPDGR